MQQIDVPGTWLILVTASTSCGPSAAAGMVCRSRPATGTLLAHFRFDHKQADELRTLYTQLMLERGFLAGLAIYPTLAHTDEIVDRYGEAIDGVSRRWPARSAPTL